MTCVESNGSAACVGDCAPAETRCDGEHVQSCSSTGTWISDATCDGADQICSNGACLVATVVGDSTPGDVTFDVPDNVWFVERVIPQTSGYVISLRVISRHAGGVGRMALWDDAAGAPGAIVAQSHSFAVEGGVDGDRAVLPSLTHVTAGQTYWLGAKFVNSVALYQNPATTVLGYDYQQMFGANPWTTMAPFPTNYAGTFAGVSLNFFMLVADQLP